MDSTLFNFLYSLSGRGAFTDFFIILFAKYVPYLLSATALIFLLRVVKGSFKQKVYALVFTALVLILSRGILTPLIRFFYHRPRPFLALEVTPLFQNESFAFPSGHATFFFALALVIFSFNKKWGWWFLGLACVNGIARVMAGVHWPSDILGGIGVAAVSFFVVHKLLEPVWRGLKTEEA